ncbi:CvpA family protein [Parasphingopyxis marina]|uniref:CvpA family protein n=1 Tax=Parasphingopyxis marina TaxID=2761622 RepID=A0A842HVX1_9SPHN|nr:CvpA family protein [Parasphingopyxis marina]MBC2778208.1 CvpA family protein [Parasphingopyxis marina]
MTALDAIVLILVGGGAILGAMRGFTYEVMTLLAWVIGVLALRLLYEPFNTVIGGFVGAQGAAPVLSFAIIFGVFFFASRFAGRRLGIGVRESFIGPIDRILGFGFGALKGLIAITLVFLLANLAMDIAYGGGSDRPDWMRESRTYPLLNASGRAIVDFVEMRKETGEEEPSA